MVDCKGQIPKASSKLAVAKINSGMLMEFATLPGHRRWIFHTLFRTFRCSEASFKSKGGKKVFRIDSSLVSESAKAIRSSTLPTRLNSFVSEDSTEGVVDMVFLCPNVD